MQNERRLQFQVGLTVLIALSIGTALVIRFGDLSKEFDQRYAVFVHLETAAGLYNGAPVFMSGLPIGHVAKVKFAETTGVIVELAVKPEVRLRADSRALVSRSLLGETAIEFIPGRSTEFLAKNDHVQGQGATDPLAAVQRLEGRAAEVLDTLTATAREWQHVGQNVNTLMDTNRGNMDAVVERAAESLHEFTVTLQAANRMINSANTVLGDPAAQRALKETLEGLPLLVDDTRRTIAGTRLAIEGVHKNMVNLAQVTEPVGQRGEVMVAKLESSLTNLDQLLSEMNRFAQLVNKPNGTLQKFATDPSLYDNMDRSSQSLAVMLKNVEPVLRDLREFSDKIARNPELLGVGGAMRPSSGLRDEEVLQKNSPPRTPPTGRTAVRTQNP